MISVMLHMSGCNGQDHVDEMSPFIPSEFAYGVLISLRDAALNKIWIVGVDDAKFF